MKPLLFVLCLLPALAQPQLSSYPVTEELRSDPLRCPALGGPQDCWDKELGSECETYGPHGGKMDGECLYRPEYASCGCFIKFE